MDVKDAVRSAINYIAEIFGPENPENIGLEEVVFNDVEDVWDITIGFSRPWDYKKLGFLPNSLQAQNPERQYKIVRIDNKSGKVKSIKIREIKIE
jgi:hypothetical protein